MTTNKYDVTALAALYFPESSRPNARRRLLKVLRAERDLWDKLTALHFKSWQRNFTPRQYEAIIDILGEPETGAEIHAAQTAAAEAPARGGKIAAVREPAREQQWKRFAAAHPVFCPFDEAQDIYAVKMDLRDFKILPKEYLPLANNSFLLHGYFNYKFLLFGYMGEQEKKWFLGVPGVFQNQEQLLAGLFGFGEFRTKHMTKQKTGEFGYWYRYLG